MKVLLAYDGSLQAKNILREMLQSALFRRQEGPIGISLHRYS